MKKTLICFLLTFALLLTLAACGKRGADTEAAAEASVPAQAEAPAETEAPTETAPAETEAVTEETRPEIPQLTNRDAFELWTNANTLYFKWLIRPLTSTGEPIVDENDVFFPEDGGAPYYPVVAEGIRSKQSLADYLSHFFDPDVYQTQLNEKRYLEKDGRLYIQYEGIGSCGAIVRSIRVKSQNGANAVIELTSENSFIGSDGPMTTELTVYYRDGDWLFSAPFPCYYDDLLYEGISY